MTGLGKAVKRHSLAPTHDRIMAVFNWQPRTYMIAFALLAITTAYLPFMLGVSPTPTTDPFFWGPYRSNLYFGIRATTPSSPLIGLMWYDSQDPNGVNKLRHECSGDDKMKWGWKTNDGESFGEHEIVDFESNVKLSTKILKSSFDSKWNSRFYIEHVNPHNPMNIKLMIYALYDSEPDVGDFLLRVASDTYDIGPDKPVVYSLKVQPSERWMMRENYIKALSQTRPEENPNLYIYEFTINSPRTISVHCSEIQHDATFDDYVFEMKASLSHESFKERFKKVFYSANWSQDESAFGQYALSNLLGGLIYLHGTTFTLAHGKEHHAIVESQPISLFTDTPSRSTFARGFLWDSGFQNLLIQEWNPILTCKILSSWLDQMSEDGWIAREQIPGEEARVNVPGQLRIQNPHYANPPGLLLSVNKLIDKMDKFDELTKQKVNEFLEANYDKFKQNYEWYFKTQHGHCGTMMHCFRWRGRSQHHTLTSGLDDYPRADLPDENELHVDLASWMAFASKVMMKYAQLIGDLNDYEHYYRNLKKIVHLIETVHWDEQVGYYTDVIMKEGGKVEHIRHFGYVSIYPLLFGIAMPSRASIVIARVKSELLTNYGLRSLSPRSSYYMNGDQYWTGPIWININYLFLGALNGSYADIPGSAEMYHVLRGGLMENMIKSFKETGFIWEQYDDVSGFGQRSHPFTGWSALILLIMAERYEGI